MGDRGTSLTSGIQTYTCMSDLLRWMNCDNFDKVDRSADKVRCIILHLLNIKKENIKYNMDNLQLNWDPMGGVGLHLNSNLWSINHMCHGLPSFASLSKSHHFDYMLNQILYYLSSKPWLTNHISRSIAFCISVKESLPQLRDVFKKHF